MSTRDRGRRAGDHERAEIVRKNIAAMKINNSAQEREDWQMEDVIRAAHAIKSELLD